MSETPTNGDPVGGEDDDVVVAGEELDKSTEAELKLAHRIAALIPQELLKRHRSFVGGTAATIMALSALMLAARVINQRREQGMRSPAEILRSISSEDLAEAARSALGSVRRRIPRWKKPEKGD